MPRVNYNQVISEIKTLDLSDQLRLLEDMATLIRKKISRIKSVISSKNWHTAKGELI